MNILFVGVFAIPINDILNGKTEKEITGWPAYFYPAYKLIKAGHNVDFAFMSNLKNYNIKVDWLRKEQIVVNVTKPDHKLKLLRVLNEIIRRIKFIFEVWHVIKNRHYDFIYCQEDPGLFANIIANMYNIPCGVRLYGDVFYHRLRRKYFQKYAYIKEKGLFRFVLIRPMLCLMYKLRKSFILVTEDGSHGDLTYSLLKPKKKKYDFYFWKSGVDKNQPTPDKAIEDKIKGIKFLAYCARVDRPKGQNRGIDVLHILHQKGYLLHLFIIGQISHDRYYYELLDQIKKYELEEYVHFTDGVSQNQMKIYGKYALANLLMGVYGQRGNVFYELFSIGCVIVALNDTSLDEYIQHGISGFLGKDKYEIADIIERIVKNPEIRDTISSDAISVAEDKILSIDERFDKEVELILSSCQKA